MKKNSDDSDKPKYAGNWKMPLVLKPHTGGRWTGPEFEPKYPVDPRSRLTPSEAERERKRAYYHANRDKVVSKKKEQKTKKAIQECEERGLPILLAPYIRFYQPTKYLKDPVGLRFDSIHQLLVFLKDVRTKDDELSLEELAHLIHEYDHR